MTKEIAQQKGHTKPICGIVMPISAIAPTYTAEHWDEVYKIIQDSAEKAGFEVNIVSYADETGIIQNNIVRNIFSNEIIVCDVSGKNPNVMFELGMRLAADKPAIIIKDELTDYSFDTGIIEHLNYPSNLNYHKILEFKEKLSNKLTKTFKASQEKDYSTFIKHFKLFHTPKGLDQEEIPQQELLIKMLEELKTDIKMQKIAVHNLQNELYNNRIASQVSKEEDKDIELRTAKMKAIEELLNRNIKYKKG